MENMMQVFLANKTVKLWMKYNHVFLEGIVATLWISLITIAVATILGTFLALMRMSKFKPLNWLYTMFVVLIGFVYFRSDSIFQANEFMRQMFSFESSTSYSVLTHLSMKVIVVLFAAALFSGAIQRPLMKAYKAVQTKAPVLVADYTCQILLTVYSIMMLVGGTHNPFIYFQF